MTTEWPDMPKPIDVMNVLANRVPDAMPSAGDIEIMEMLEPDYGPHYGSIVPESKSPMKYAVDYKLVDEDGQVMEDTNYFITSDDAWDRAKELYELSGLDGQITFRAL